MNDKLKSLEDKQNQAKELREQLKRSLALEEFMPDAFHGGACKIRVTSTAQGEDAKVAFILASGGGLAPSPFLKFQMESLWGFFLRT